MSQFNPKKILVIKHGSLGDIVFALEAILAIHKKFNNTIIDLVTEEKFIPFFKKMNMFHQFLIDNRKGFFATCGLINKIIFGKYDLVIDLQNSKRTNMYHFFINIFSKAKINGSRNNVHERYIIPPQGTESPTQGLLNQLQLLGIEEINPNFSWLENNHHDLDFDKNKQVNLKIYKAESEDGETWGNIQELPFNDDEFSTAHPAFSTDEKRLYFASDRPGSFGYSDIWYVDILDDGEYGDPVNLGPNINTEFRESFPFISSDNILYFSSDGRMGLGGFDIYYSNLDSYGFPDESINFGEPLNSRMDDFGFIYNSKNNFGYFSSNRNGYNGSKSDEVYQFKMLASSPCGSVLSGIVRDKNTGQILPGAEVELEDNYGNLIARQIVKEDAKYDFSNEAECSKCYTVKARKGIGYSSFQKNICIPESSTKIFTNIELDWAKDCLPDDLECLFNINPIYFDLDKYYIRRDAAKELKKVYTVMIRYPNIKIHIESHTDSRASNRYNLALSYNRARSTKSWLVKRGINEERISTSALGEMDLDNYCEDNINCQEQEHQMNRRSIFKIREN